MVERGVALRVVLAKVGSAALFAGEAAARDQADEWMGMIEQPG
jgi:hypothetical protein